MTPEEMINNIAAVANMVDFLDGTKRGLIDVGWEVEAAEAAAVQLMSTILAAGIRGGQ